MPNFFFGQLHQLVCPSKMVIHAFQMGHLGSLKKKKEKRENKRKKLQKILKDH